MIARIVDDSEFFEVKQEYDALTVCGWAKIGGLHIGIITNNGPITPQGATKAAQFIHLCEQTKRPLLFLHNTTGFMVGTDAEQNGIIKHDDQLLQLLVKRDQNQVSVEICGQTLGISIIEQQAEKFIYEVDGVRRSIDYVLDGNQLYLDAVNGNISIENITYAAPETSDVAGDGHIRAPMDGAIINILVNAGDTVTKGQTLLILEAMKIQQQIKSDVDGVVNEIIGQVGQQVKKRQLVLNIQA